jgi:protein involved in polysaccharide export with SLBB domain
LRAAWVGFLAVGGFGAALAQTPVETASEASPEQISRIVTESSVSAAEAAASLRAHGVSEEQVEDLLGAAPGDSLGETIVSPDSASAVEERVEEAPEEVSEEAHQGGELVPFGYSLFENSPDSYRQPTFGPVDPDYPLGAGDTIVLDVWGDTVFRIEGELDREGGVNLPDVGRVVLAGQTLEQVRRTLRHRLSEVYSGLDESDGGRATTHVSVTVGALRVIKVFVVGRARRPGGYDLSAAATAFHALFFAGGPTRQGSLRDIRVLRGGKEIAVLDVYDYLRSGKRDGDIRLENDDTIFIPPTGSRVAVQGEVRENGIYELRPGETLAEMLATAGGFTERAFGGRIQVERILSLEEQEETGEDRKIFDFDYDDQARSRALRDGDQVTVFPIADRMRNFVTVSGDVRRPGTYELRPGSSLRDVLSEAGGVLETAFLERAQVIRTLDDETRHQLPVDLTKVLAGQPDEAFALEPRDEIVVSSIWDLRDEHSVSIYGAVRRPGQYELRERMTLGDLLLQAGGATEYAYVQEVEISRIRRERNEGLPTAEILKVPLTADYLAHREGGLELLPFDNVFVRQQPNYELQRNVTISGEVVFPGVYTLRHPQETLAEVVERAGGLKATAYPKGFSMFRNKDDVGRVALDLEQALKDMASKDNVILFAGDALHIPEEPKTVTVRGAVGYPTSFVYDRGWSIGDYIDRAGGTTEKADSKRIHIVYSTGAAARVKRFWFDPEVLPGSTIMVPVKEEKEGIPWGNVIRDSASLLASVATVVLVVNQVNRNN